MYRRQPTLDQLAGVLGEDVLGGDTVLGADEDKEAGRDHERESADDAGEDLRDLDDSKVGRWSQGKPEEGGNAIYGSKLDLLRTIMRKLYEVRLK
jgi:hypothetical protein